MQKLLHLVVVLCIAFACQAENAPEGILFLTIHVDSTSICIIDSKMTGGTLKRSKADNVQGGIVCSLISSDGKTLWQSSLGEPLQQRFEYVDNTGQFRTQWKTLSSNTIVVRVPHLRKAKRLQFGRQDAHAKSKDRATERILGDFDIEALFNRGK
jgi:hypothetical protein